MLEMRFRRLRDGEDPVGDLRQPEKVLLKHFVPRFTDTSGKSTGMVS